MRAVDHIEQAWSNLRKKRLRTFLTTSGVIIAIGALICMFAFAQGVQRNMRRQFNEMELFNYITVSVRNVDPRHLHGHDPDDGPASIQAEPPADAKRSQGLILDAQMVEEILQIR